MKKKLLVVATAVFALTLIVPLSAFSQANDHLKCRHIEGADKVKASELQQVRQAVVDQARKHPAAYPEIHVTSSEKGMGIADLRAAVLADAEL